MHGCTIIARNYLAHARVLADSFLAQHPAATFTVLILDADDGLDRSTEPFEIVTLSDVIDAEEAGRLQLIYSVIELATAVKPQLLSVLLDRFGEPVMYLDPDIQVFGSLEHIFDLAAKHGIVLTPHSADPIPRDGRNPSETFILQSGVYNLGFIAVGPGAEQFLAWWWERLRRDCVVQPEAGLFVDQRWIDFVPGLFDHAIVRDAGLNVAYWNLATRDVAGSSADGWTVNGDPLVFFHFSGYDPDRPWLLSKHQGTQPRILLSDNPALQTLCDQYGSALLDRGYRDVSAIPYGLAALPDGTTVDRWMRRLYRDAVRGAELDADAELPPHPITETPAFLNWMSAPSGEGPAWLSRYLYAVWLDRWDLRETFPDLGGNDAERFRRWLEEHGRVEADIPDALVPAAGDDADASGAPPVGAGINLAGYLRAELGIGEAARQLIPTLETAGEQVATVTFDRTASRQGHEFEDLAPVADTTAPFDVNIVTVNADQMERFTRAIGPRFFGGRATVGYWAWEVEEFPDRWPIAFDLVDEIWMNSEFAATAVRTRTDKPVHALPLTVTTPAVPDLSRSDLGMPEGFVFLFSFDFASGFERKNPLGAVRAFTTAFAPNEGPHLILKSINGEANLPELERLRHAVADRSDITLMDGYLPADRKNALTALCDAYISLHRSEGFGITMAEAMALGKPTIGTAYSGNLEFMTPQNSFLIQWEPVGVPVGADPYPVGCRWAEPDTDHAAGLMRKIVEDPAAAAEVGAQARDDMARLHGPEARAERTRSLLERLRETHAGSITMTDAEQPAEAPQPEGEGVAAARADARRTVGRGRQNVRAGQRFKNALRKPFFILLRPFAEDTRRADKAVLRYVLALEQHLDELVNRLTELREIQAGTLRHEMDVRARRHTDALRGDVAARHDALNRQLDAMQEQLDTVRESIDGLNSGVKRLGESATSDRESLRAAVAELAAQIRDFENRI